MNILTNTENVNPIFWGPHVWSCFYSFISTYPKENINVTNEQKQAMKSQFESLTYLLPCCTCRQSYSNFSRESDTNIYDMNNYVNRETLIKTIFLLRKKVENKVGYEYYTTLNYFKFKLDNMICNGNKNEYYANMMHECPFIPEIHEDSMLKYLKKHKKYVKDYNESHTPKIIKVLKTFLNNPNSCPDDHNILWIERNDKCYKIIKKIYENMCVNNYDIKTSFGKDKDRELHLQLFYLGCTIIPKDDILLLIS